jgi:GNAT superfamily N-acetyltransferase
MGLIDVRQATVDDAVEIARLNQIFNESQATPEEIARQLIAASGVERLYLAEIKKRVVGYACLRIVPTICSAELWAELTELFVEEAFRRQGVGRVLMESVEEAARAAGARELFLLTGFKNVQAHHFYHSIGYSLRCLTMHKWLEPVGRSQ